MDIRIALGAVRHPIKMYRSYIAKEHTIHRRDGEDIEKTYYVIRCKLPECGFFALYTYIIDHLAIADDRGYIPVLDFDRYPCLYKETVSIRGTMNPWCYYFLPWNDISTDDMKKKANVILAPIAFPHYKAIYYYSNHSKNILPSRNRIYDLNCLKNKYFKFVPEVEVILDNNFKLLEKNGKVLGVHVRGTDMYTEGKQHPIPTGKTKDFTEIDNIIASHDIKFIFLCTDTESTILNFKEKYGDCVITSDAVRQKSDNNTGIHKDNQLGGGRRFHRYKLGLEVLTDMYLLSKCDVLACGPSNVPFIAMIYNNCKYERIYYYA